VLHSDAVKARHIIRISCCIDPHSSTRKGSALCYNYNASTMYATVAQFSVGILTRITYFAIVDQSHIQSCRSLLSLSLSLSLANSRVCNIISQQIRAIFSYLSLLLAIRFQQQYTDGGHCLTSVYRLCLHISLNYPLVGSFPFNSLLDRFVRYMKSENATLGWY